MLLTSPENKPYNCHLISELTKAIHSSHDSPPGPDNIHYLNLPSGAIHCNSTQDIFNYYVH